MQVTSIPQSFVTFSPIEPAAYAAPHTFWQRMKSSRLPGLSREHTIAVGQLVRGKFVVTFVVPMKENCAGPLFQN
jgi:hypothetical protein